MMTRIQPVHRYGKGSNGDIFVINFNGLKELNISPRAIITITLDDDSDIKTSFTIDQSSFTEHSVVIQTTSRTKRGSLFNWLKL